MTKACDKYLDRNQFGMVDDVYNHYAPHKLSSWLGFKWWFVSYKMKGKNDV